ncbi:hypothetical protein [Streptomyces sp. ISL-11]|uniref:hypothetical protein n=1 Tax=Streptomyces sp. ISL-11 TaxID=2819174 RepID=UPI001BE83653|nr:hypothetical protein [Streptomyces sp. ISL-11]MBT2385268.1 hypothetical protein [Streptomyces sp. ISL-11]
MTARQRKVKKRSRPAPAQDARVGAPAVRRLAGPADARRIARGHATDAGRYARSVLAAVISTASSPARQAGRTTAVTSGILYSLKRNGTILERSSTYSLSAYVPATMAKAIGAGDTVVLRTYRRRPKPGAPGARYRVARAL